MAHAGKTGKGMVDGSVVGHPQRRHHRPEPARRNHLAQTLRGENRLRGKDQTRVRNQRETRPGSLDADDRPPDAPADDR